MRSRPWGWMRRGPCVRPTHIGRGLANRPASSLTARRCSAMHRSVPIVLGVFTLVALAPSSAQCRHFPVRARAAPDRRHRPRPGADHRQPRSRRLAAPRTAGRAARHPLPITGGALRAHQPDRNGAAVAGRDRLRRHRRAQRRAPAARAPRARPVRAAGRRRPQASPASALVGLRPALAALIAPAGPLLSGQGPRRRRRARAARAARPRITGALADRRAVRARDRLGTTDARRAGLDAGLADDRPLAGSTSRRWVAPRA